MSKSTEKPNGNLRLVHAERDKPVTPDPEMKPLLDDLKRRYRVIHERNKRTDDTPDAA